MKRDTADMILLAAAVVLAGYLPVTYLFERKASADAVECLRDVSIFASASKIIADTRHCEEQYQSWRPFWYDIYNPVNG